ncbi:MAG: HEAT repeat domain-containing protein [Rhodopirellula sp.]|nr:HEAT repeat domain-containing protein [Rhodopirellula sp.]
MQHPEDWDLATVRHETELYLFERDVKAAGDAYLIRHRNLFSIRERVCSVLVDILQDESGSERLTTQIQGEKDVPNLPIERICFLLRSNVSDEVVPLLIPFAQNRDARVRIAVAYTLGESGHDSSMITVINLLGDAVDEVVESTYSGLTSAGDLSDQYQMALINRLEQLIQTNSESDNPCHRLVWLPHERATAAVNRLLADPRVDPNRILINLWGSPTTADRDVLLKLVADREEMLRDEHVSEALRYLLILIGRHAHQDDGQLLRKFIDDGSERVALGAAEGLLDWHEVGDFAKWLYSHESLPSLSLQQIRDLMNVRNMIDEYGVTKSFWDLEVDECRNAVSGLHLIGAVEGAEIIDAAIALVVADDDESESIDQDHSTDTQWHELDQRWKQMGQDLEIQLYLYVIEHRDEFLAISPQ